MLAGKLRRIRVGNRSFRRLDPARIGRALSAAAIISVSRCSSALPRRTCGALASQSQQAAIHQESHSHPTHLRKGGYNIRTIQDLLGCQDVSTTIVHTHILNVNRRTPAFGVRPAGSNTHEKTSGQQIVVSRRKRMSVLASGHGQSSAFVQDTRYVYGDTLRVHAEYLCQEFGGIALGDCGNRTCRRVSR